MTIQEAIEARHSVRAYKDQPDAAPHRHRSFVFQQLPAVQMARTAENAASMKKKRKMDFSFVFRLINRIFAVTYKKLRS